jgi:tetratricopeptide (TPR) repeat protein
VLILRIRQAECALADGRLDEAFEIAQDQEVRRHHHGQRLIGRLARALIQRGQESLAAERFQPALADCNKAEKLGGNLPEITRLRAAVCDAIIKDQQAQQQEALRVAQAQQQIENGWLSVGGRILEEADRDNGRVGLVRQELAAARLRTDDAVAKAQQALEQGDLEGAIEIALGARLGQCKGGTAGELLRQIRSQGIQRVRAELEQGRIDRAQSFLQRLMPLVRDGTEVAELTEALAWCRQAAQQVAAGQPGAALPLLRKVKVVCPSARWLDTALADAKRAAEAYEELGAGPLGLTAAQAAGNATGGRGPQTPNLPLGDPSVKAEGLGEGFAASEPAQRQALLDAAARRNPTPENSEGADMPSRFVLQLDGIGSFIVFRQSRVTIGPISSSARPMLALMADPNLPTVSIERMEGDYFVRCPSPVEVNGRAVTEKLLADGDRIALSPRCQVRFHLPNPASTTAVLTVSGARLSRPDVKHVILMDRDILIGPFANDHIRTEKMAEPVALFAQNGRLLCRAKESILVDGRGFDPNVGLGMDRHIEIGRISMVVARLGE